MAIVQSAWAKGNLQAVRPQTAGAVHAQRFVFDLSSQGVNTADILELGVLPPYARIADAIFITEGTFTGVTADIGIMSGTFGSTDGSRTSGAELFDDVDCTVQLSRLTKRDSVLLAATEADRSIGVKFSANVSAAAGKKVTLVLFYHQ